MLALIVTVGLAIAIFTPILLYREYSLNKECSEYKNGICKQIMTDGTACYLNVNSQGVWCEGGKK